MTNGETVTWTAEPSADGGLTEETAAAHVHGIVFKTGPPSKVGVELEWLVRDARDPALPVPAKRTFPAVADLTAPTVLPDPAALPSGGMLTTEPGGQLELSSAPADSLSECITAVRGEMTTLRQAVDRAGLRLQGYGYDPLRTPHRVLDLPRYAAMEEFFDRSGPWGRQMMCNTASVQVCLDAGQDTTAEGGYRWRWKLAHQLGPVLVAAFANSPIRQGKPSGWRSTRQEVWAHLDPGRTRPPPDGDRDPRDTYADYALDAELMLVRREGSPSWSAPPGVTFRAWLRGAGERQPTVDDLTYHLSTLFPPVRPQGHLELRMIDAQPGDDGWVVPAAVAWALFEDPEAADTAMAAAEPLAAGNGHRGPACATPGDPWLRAAREGPADREIARASQRCFEAADAALGRANAPADIRDSVAEFTERYVLRRRCPADDQLEGKH
jgi:glutamate--cysteine ligase